MKASEVKAKSKKRKRTSRVLGQMAKAAPLKSSTLVGPAPTTPGWWFVCNDDGHSQFVPGYRDRFYDGRAEAVRLINEARIHSNPKAELVSIDGVAPLWTEEGLWSG